MEGAPADLAGDSAAIAIAADRWGGYDGESLVVGAATELSALATALAGKPLIAHDVKSLGAEVQGGLLAVAEPGSLELAHDTMVAAYLLDPARRTYELDELAADGGLSIAASDGDARGGEASTPARKSAEALSLIHI